MEMGVQKLATAVRTSLRHAGSGMDFASARPDMRAKPVLKVKRICHTLS